MGDHHGQEAGLKCDFDYSRKKCSTQDRYCARGFQMVLLDLYLKRFDLTKDLLFKTFELVFGTNFVIVIIQYWSSNHYYYE